MDCEQFRAWVENRDLSDQSEADRALKHQLECQACRTLLELDKTLDGGIGRKMAREPLPEHLERVVSLNLGSPASSRRIVPTGVIRLFSMLAGAGALLLLFYLYPTDYSARKEFGKAIAQDHIMHNYDSDLESIKIVEQWLGNNAPFRAALPAVAKFGWNYTLVGGRICPIGDCEAVHLVYRSGSKLISLYIISPEQVTAPVEVDKTYRVKKKGYDIKMWIERNLFYALVT